MNERRIAAGALLLLGALALLEARRLSALREEMVAGAAVGDDTFPWIIGASLLLLGLYTLFVARWRPRHIAFAAWGERRRLVGSAGALVAYVLVTPYLGYAATTLVISSGLYRSIGGYKWPVAFLIGAVTTGALYLVFRVWLVQPLPTGWIGI